MAGNYRWNDTDMTSPRRGPRGEDSPGDFRIVLQWDAASEKILTDCLNDAGSQWELGK